MLLKDVYVNRYYTYTYKKGNHIKKVKVQVKEIDFTDITVDVVKEYSGYYGKKKKSTVKKIEKYVVKADSLEPIE